MLSPAGFHVELSSHVSFATTLARVVECRHVPSGILHAVRRQSHLSPVVAQADLLLGVDVVRAVLSAHAEIYMEITAYYCDGNQW